MRLANLGRALLHEQVPGVWEELEADGAGQVVAEALGPAGPEVRVVGSPQDQGRVVEAAQPVDDLGGPAVVGGIELAGQEPRRLGPAVGIGEVGPPVPVDELVVEHLSVLDRLAQAEDQTQDRAAHVGAHHQRGPCRAGG